jgi:hypothetical protein
MSRKKRHARPRAKGNGLIALGGIALVALGTAGLAFRFTGKREHPFLLLFGSLFSLSTGLSLMGTAFGRRAWNSRSAQISDVGDAIQESLAGLDPFARVQVLRDVAMTEAKRAGMSLPNVPGLSHVPVLSRFAASSSHA